MVNLQRILVIYYVNAGNVLEICAVPLHDIKVLDLTFRGNSKGIVSKIKA